MLASYRLNHEKAASIPSSGKTVILAATYSRESYHDKLRELSITHHVPLKFFLLQIPDEVVKTRLEERILHGSSSNIVSLETYQEVKDRYVTFHGNELIFIDASRPLGKTIEEISTEIENIGPASGKSNLPRS
jgi:predicted kinase